MSETENSRARAEALNEPGTRALRSARRAQLWEGLNRYLASESAHARKVAAEEKKEAAAHRDRAEHPDHVDEDAQGAG